MTGFSYPGSELQLFAQAHNWKRYWTGIVRRYIRGDVLEVGAGIGSNTGWLRMNGTGRWVCLEPDPALAALLARRIAGDPSLTSCEMIVGTVEDLPEGEAFQTIIYADVLEHIEDDWAELDRAAGHLAPGGRLAVLGPAHPWLFTSFDEAIGHHRRYTADSLQAVSPKGLRLLSTRYLDAAGLLASAANRLLLRRPMPTDRQIAFWDRILARSSRFLDPLLGYRVGKSILCVWERPDDESVEVPGSGRH